MQPPTARSESDGSLYEAYYGLREHPFALTTDPKFIFWSASHRRAYDDLLVGLRRREGLLVLTGETGTGKTTLCRAVVEALGHRTFSALVLNPYMAGTEVLRVILRDFGLVSRDEIRRGSLSRADAPQLLDTLEGFLRSLVPLDARAVVIIDEAQSLAPEALDQVRMLGAYEEDGQRLLQIVLCGQPGLSNTLKSEPLRALNERVTRRAGLNPLLAPEVEAYVRHRLTVAGADSPSFFASEAIALVAEYSRGLPRRINVLCDRALDEGRVTSSPTIGPDLVKRAARSLAGPSTSQTPAAPPEAPTSSSAPAVTHGPRPVPVPENPPPPPRVVVPPQPGPDEVVIEEPELDFQPDPFYDEPPERLGGRSTLLIGGGAIVLAVIIIVIFYILSVAAAPVSIPPTPKDPRAVGTPATAPPPPTDNQIRSLLDGRWSADPGGTATGTGGALDGA